MAPDPVHAALSAIEAIVERASNEVDAYASDVFRLDEEIQDQLDDYRRCRDPDHRTAYAADIEDLVGRRRNHREAIFETIEEAEAALHVITEALDGAFADLEAFADGGEKVPREDEFSIPPP